MPSDGFRILWGNPWGFDSPRPHLSESNNSTTETPQNSDKTGVSRHSTIPAKDTTPTLPGHKNDPSAGQIYDQGMTRAEARPGKDAAPSLPADLPPAVVVGLRKWSMLPGHIRTAVEALLKGASE